MDESEIVEDPLVSLVFQMMPEVMMMVNQLNISNTYFGSDPAGFMQDMVVDAYHGTWSALSEILTGNATSEPDPHFATASVRKPVTAVKADVSKIKIYVWTASNLGLTIAGLLLLGLLQWQHRRPFIHGIMAGEYYGSILTRALLIHLSIPA